MSATSDRRPLAIVTGASRSRGIGAAVCRALAHMKIDIFFTYWRAHDRSLYGQEAEEYRELLSGLREEGIRCECLEIDLSLPQSAAQIIDEAERCLGPATILV